MRTPPRRAARQQGSVLLVAMIMLLMAAILTGAMLRGSLTSAQAIGNMQWRAEAVTAANDAIDRLLSTAEFATKTADIVKLVNEAPFQVDINGDGVNDIAVSFPATLPDGITAIPTPGPTCLRQQPILAKDLDPAVTADLACFNSSSGSNQGLGIGAAGGTATALAQSPSLCSETEWSIRVRAIDAVTSTAVDVVQGVGVRVNTDVASNYCK
jgi:hypothetical protein